MLEVTTRLVGLTGMPDGPAKERLAAANKEALDLARFIRRTSRRDACDEHTDEPSYLTVVVRFDGSIYVEKTDFCCDEFAARFAFPEIGRRASGHRPNASPSPSRPS